MGLRIVHAWGMSEMSPNRDHLPSRAGRRQGADPEVKFRPPRATQELRSARRSPGRRRSGEAPWDGSRMGELHGRGPCVAGSLLQEPSEATSSHDGLVRTG